ncbi:UNVERIFIED_ORG: hypothetical protein ABIB52_004674 [Arthrobacter sp. UYCu721]
MCIKRKNFIAGTSSRVKPYADISFLSFLALRTCGNSLLRRR